MLVHWDASKSWNGSLGHYITSSRMWSFPRMKTPNIEDFWVFSNFQYDTMCVIMCTWFLDPNFLFLDFTSSFCNHKKKSHSSLFCFLFFLYLIFNVFKDNLSDFKQWIKEHKFCALSFFLVIYIDCMISFYYLLTWMHRAHNC